MASRKLFINYRRDDSRADAGRLYDRLQARYPGRVFRDVGSLEPGVEWHEAIEKVLGSSDACIVVIGRNWLTVTDRRGQAAHRRPARHVPQGSRDGDHARHAGLSRAGGRRENAGGRRSAGQTCGLSRAATLSKSTSRTGTRTSTSSPGPSRNRSAGAPKTRQVSPQSDRPGHRRGRRRDRGGRGLHADAHAGAGGTEGRAQFRGGRTIGPDASGAEPGKSDPAPQPPPQVRAADPVGSWRAVVSAGGDIINERAEYYPGFELPRPAREQQSCGHRPVAARRRRRHPDHERRELPESGRQVFVPPAAEGRLRLRRRMLRLDAPELGRVDERRPRCVGASRQPSQNQHRRRDDGGESHVHSSARGAGLHVRLRAERAHLPADRSDLSAEPRRRTNAVGDVSATDPGLTRPPRTRGAQDTKHLKACIASS